MRIFLSAGEASGDAYGAELVRAFLAEGLVDSQAIATSVAEQLVQAGVPENVQPRYAELGKADQLAVALRTYEPEVDLTTEDGLVFEQGVERLRWAMLAGKAALVDDMGEGFTAVGGSRLREAGAYLLHDSSSWGAVGILESLKVVPRVWLGYKAARRELGHGEPGLFVPIDFGYMNVRLARFAKERGWHVLYFIPPGSWRRDRQGGDLPAVTDAIVTPFPWSAEILDRMGANAHFFGHPLVTMVGRAPAAAERKGVAILPGSRHHEVRGNLRAIALALGHLGLRATLALAPSIDERWALALWRAAGGGVVEVRRDTYAVLKSCQAAVVCSGTATLECALCGTPQVVVYRGSKLMELEYRIRRPKFEFISLPNLLLQRPVVPELIQGDASPEKIASALKPLVDGGPELSVQCEASREIEDILGPGNCFASTAKLARFLGGLSPGPEPWNAVLRSQV